MEACNKKWGIKNHTMPSDKEIYMWGWKEALEWVLRLHYSTALGTIKEIEDELNRSS